MKKVSIRNKIIIYLSMFMLLAFFILTSYVYSQMYNNILGNTYNTLSIVTKQNARNLNDMFNMISHTTVGLAATEEVTEWLKDSQYLNLETADFYLKKNNLLSQLRNYLLFNSAWKLRLISTVSIFVDDTYVDSIYIKPMPIETLKRQVVEAYSQIEQSQVYVQNLPPNIHNGTIYHMRKLLNPHNTNKTVTFLVGTDEKLIADKYKELVYLDGIVGYVVNKEGVVFSSSDKSLLSKKIHQEVLENINYKTIKQIDVSGEQYVVASQPIEDSELVFVISVPKNSIIEKTKQTMQSYILLCFIIILILMVGAVLFITRSTYFLKELAQAIDEIRNKNYEVKMPQYKDVSLNNLSNTFNNMSSEIKFLIQDTYQKQLLLKDMQIKFLQYQMNPHFLFNVLLTIQMKAKFSKDESIYKMVNSLTALLRAGIYTEQESKITLKQELEYAEFYLYLQQVRFEERLEYIIEVENDRLLEAYIPKLCIEPIVENAVVHGLEGKVGKGLVIIKVCENTQGLLVEVSDNGLGFDANKVTGKFNEVLNEEDNMAPKHTKIGIKNTNERIRLIYGMAYGVEIESEINKGTTVKIHMPIDTGGRFNV